MGSQADLHKFAYLAGCFLLQHRIQMKAVRGHAVHPVIVFAKLYNVSFNSRVLLEMSLYGKLLFHA